MIWSPEGFIASYTGTDALGTHNKLYCNNCIVIIVIGLMDKHQQRGLIWVMTQICVFLA